MRAFETRDQKSDRCGLHPSTKDVETVYAFRATIALHPLF
jgi:hypothetical protein